MKEQIEQEIIEKLQQQREAMFEANRELAYLNWHRLDAVIVYLQEKLKQMEQEAKQ